MMTNVVLFAQIENYLINKKKVNSDRYTYIYEYR